MMLVQVSFLVVSALVISANESPDRGFATAVICDPMRPSVEGEVTPVICDPMRPREEETVTPVICDPMRPVDEVVTPVVCIFPFPFRTDKEGEEENEATGSTRTHATSSTQSSSPTSTATATSTSPASPASPASPSPRPVSQEKTCDCVIAASQAGKRVSANDLLGGQYMGYTTPFGKCDEEALDQCAQQCKLFFPTYTNNFDLRMAPLANREGTSLASRICEKLVTQPLFRKVQLFAQLKCLAAGGRAEATFTSKSLVSSKQRVSCFGRRAVTFPF